MNFQSVAQINSNKIKFYSPFNFDRKINNIRLINCQLSDYQNKIDENLFEKIIIENEIYFFIYEKLTWDTEYFKIPTYRLYNVIASSYQFISKAISKFIEMFIPKNSYCFIEIPSEDIKLLSGLGKNNFKLVETRLTYYHNNIHSHNYPRFKIREATKQDIVNLKNVASTMRNDFDRFHADETFDVTIADQFLATYIENSILGFADYVMVPNEELQPSDSFLTANYLKNNWSALNYKVSKMVLSAVSSTTNRGWYIKLVSEMLYHLRDNIGSECVFLNTQSTNRAVFSTWEKLGFKLGNTTHIFSITK